MVDFLLVLIELLSPALTVEVQLADVGRNRDVRKEGVGHFERRFQVDGDVAHNQSMDRWIGE